MSKRNKRNGFWKGMGVGALLALLFACAPPQVGGQGPYPACKTAVTTMFEGDPVPCLPVPPQRLDVYVEIAGDQYGATKRCGDYGGSPTNEAPQHAGWLRCRTVDPDRL